MTTGKERRAALYARFSTDLQRDRSIEDQLALCTQHAERIGATVVATYSDRARSGAAIFGRDGLLELMLEARAGAFDVVIVEALDRLSRDQEDLAGIYKRLTFAGVDIEAVHDGVADPVQIGVRGLLGQLFLVDLKHKTRRGMSAQAREGRFWGARVYGYRQVPGQPGELEIVPEEAEVVRRIYREYLEGRTTLEIARGLNRDGIPSASGGAWGASRLGGNSTFSTGTLRNPLYVGELVWNRTRTVVNPETGKRVRRPNPREEWVVVSRPELAILDRETWEAAQARLKPRARNIGGRGTAPRRLLSGLMKCGECGRSMVIRGRDDVGAQVCCSSVREGSRCGHTRCIYLYKIEAAVIDRLLAAVSQPELMRTYLKAYHDEMNRITAKARRNEAKLRRKLSAAERKIDRLIALVDDPDAPIERLKAQLREAEQERRRIENELELCADEVPVVTLHPEAAERWRADLEYLRDHIASVHGTDEIAQRVRTLVDKIIVLPGPPRGPVEIEITGKLSGLLGEHHASVLANATPSCRSSDHRLHSVARIIPFGRALVA